MAFLNSAILACKWIKTNSSQRQDLRCYPNFPIFDSKSFSQTMLLDSNILPKNEASGILFL